MPAHSSSSTHRPHDADFYIDDDENVWMQFGHGPMEGDEHRYSCGPALAMTVEMPQFQFLADGGLQFLGVLVYIDESLMYLWLCSGYGFFGVPAEVVEEFHTSLTRGLALFALGFWTLCPPALCIWLALGPGVYAPVYGGFWKNFSFLSTWVTAPEPSAHGNLGITSAFPSLAGLFLRKTWLDSGYMFLVSSSFLLDKFSAFSSEWELGSCGRFTSLLSGVIFTSCSMVKCARSMLRLRGLPELMALGIWTFFSSAPCIRQATLPLSQDCMRRVFPMFDTGGEVARSPGVLTPRLTCHQ